VTGENELLAKALREAVKRGLVTRSGEGKARKPYVYSVSRTRGETDKTNNPDKTDETAQDGSCPLVRVAGETAGRAPRVLRCRCGGSAWAPDPSGSGERCAACGAWSPCSVVAIAAAEHGEGG